MRYEKTITRFTDTISHLNSLVERKKAAILLNVKDNEIMSMDIVELQRELDEHRDAIKVLSKAKV